MASPILNLYISVSSSGYHSIDVSFLFHQQLLYPPCFSIVFIAVVNISASPVTFHVQHPCVANAFVSFIPSTVAPYQFVLASPQYCFKRSPAVHCQMPVYRSFDLFLNKWILPYGSQAQSPSLRFLDAVHDG